MKTTSDKIRIAVFDDNLFFRESMRLLFEGHADFNLTGVFEDANNVLRDVKKSKPDVVLMDIEMPGISGINAVTLLKKKYRDIKVMMLTDYDDDQRIYDSICAGADGYKLKTASAKNILDAVRNIYEGHSALSASVARKVLNLFSLKLMPDRSSAPLREKKELWYLTPREKDVLNELVKGHSHKIIAHNLGITYDTVRAHIKNIYRKLQVSSISGAVAKAIKQNIIS